MSKKEIFVKCEVCERDKKTSEYYTSENPKHKYGCITICKKCANNMIDMDNVETLINFLKRVDRCFKYDLFLSAKNGKRVNKVGAYFTNIGMSSFRELDYSHSEGIEEALKENYKERFKTVEEIKEEKKIEKKSELQLELEDLNMTEKQLEKHKIFWGNGYTPYEYDSFQKRYDSLIDNYPNKTVLHIENLKTYVVYKIKAEHLVASNSPDPNQIKLYTDLAIKQSTIAKLNLDKLDKSDFTSGMDSFSELVRKVEEHVDIIPILPKFIERPQDKIDVAIHCFINYERRLSGMPEVEYDEIYEFYQQSLRDYLEDETKNPEIKKNIVKKKIIRHNGTTREILFYDVYAVIDNLKENNPDSKFIQNLDKWVELVSYFRFYPDMWYDLITPTSGGIYQNCDQRVFMRVMARFKFVYAVFSRGYGKTFTQLMYNFHTCIFYPNMEIAMSAQTMENASSLVESKYREVLRFYPMLEKELKGKPLISKEKAIVNFKSGGMIDTLQNGQSSKGQRRKRIAVEVTSAKASYVMKVA